MRDFEESIKQGGEDILVLEAEISKAREAHAEVDESEGRDCGEQRRLERAEERRRLAARRALIGGVGRQRREGDSLHENAQLAVGEGAEACLDQRGEVAQHEGVVRGEGDEAGEQLVQQGFVEGRQGGPEGPEGGHDGVDAGFRDGVELGGLVEHVAERSDVLEFSLGEHGGDGLVDGGPVEEGGQEAAVVVGVDLRLAAAQREAREGIARELPADVGTKGVGEAPHEESDGGEAARVDLVEVLVEMGQQIHES